MPQANENISLGRSNLILVGKIALKDYSVVSKLRGRMCRIKARSARHIVNTAKNTETARFNRKMHYGIKLDLPLVL